MTDDDDDDDRDDNNKPMSLTDVSSSSRLFARRSYEISWGVNLVVIKLFITVPVHRRCTLAYIPRWL